MWNVTLDDILHQRFDHFTSEVVDMYHRSHLLPLFDQRGGAAVALVRGELEDCLLAPNADLLHRLPDRNLARRARVELAQVSLVLDQRRARVEEVRETEFIERHLLESVSQSVSQTVNE